MSNIKHYITTITRNTDTRNVPITNLDLIIKIVKK